MNQLKLEEIIKIATKPREYPTKELKIKRLNGKIKIQALDPIDIKKIVDEKSDNSDAEIVMRGVIEPKIMNPKLLEALDCVSFIEVVDKIFTLTERNAIAVQIFELSNPPDAVEIIDTIKN